MKLVRSILSVLIVSCLLFSSMGFSVSRHYCMGTLVNENFYAISSEGCWDSELSGEFSLSSNCCQNEHLHLAGISIIKADDDFHWHAITAGYQPVAITIPNFFAPKVQKHFNYKVNAPPPDILIQVQRFLI